MELILNQPQAAVPTSYTQFTVKKKHEKLILQVLDNGQKINIRPLTADKVFLKFYLLLNNIINKKQSKKQKTIAKSSALLNDTDSLNDEDDIVNKNFLEKKNYSMSDQNC